MVGCKFEIVVPWSSNGGVVTTVQFFSIHGQSGNSTQPFSIDWLHLHTKNPSWLTFPSKSIPRLLLMPLPSPLRCNTSFHGCMSLASTCQEVSLIFPLLVTYTYLCISAPKAPSTSSGSNICAIATSNPDGRMLFACGACSQHNTVNIAKETFYVVMAGTNIGIFRDSVSWFFLYPHEEWLRNWSFLCTCWLFCHWHQMFCTQEIFDAWGCIRCPSRCTRPRCCQIAAEGLRGQGVLLALYSYVWYPLSC